MFKIVIIGAGHGGLQAAKVLAEGGNDVTVYEKNSIDKLSRDRYDTIESSVFDDLDIPLPEGTFKDNACAFTAPFSKKALVLDLEPMKRDWTVDRRVLAPQLVKAAEEKGAKFVFETEVTSLILDNTAVKGIKIGDEEILADLVIDASGVFSKFREALPVRFGITPRPDNSDVFFTWDAMFEHKEGVDLPENYGFLMHLKYMGEKCVCWCVPEFEDKFAAFIGKAGGLKKDEFNKLYAQLKLDYPWLGEKKLRGGDFASIPIRYPLTKMFAPGYVCVGDSAFMPIPLVGCGVANSLRGGQMLGEAVVKADSVSAEALWDYQVNYFKKIGAACCLIDFVKRALLDCDNNELKMLFDSDIITNEELKAILDGKLSFISAKELASRIKKAYKIRGLFGDIFKAAFKGLKAMSVALSIPKKYNSLKAAKWVAEMENAMAK